MDQGRSPHTAVPGTKASSTTDAAHTAAAGIDLRPVEGPRGGSAKLEWQPAEQHFEAAGVHVALVPNGPVHVELSGAEGVVEASVRGSVRLAYPCDRCLEPAESDVPIRYRQRFVQPDVYEELSVPEREGEEDGVPYAPYTGHRADLSESLRRDALLEAPAKHVCRPDCRGLCPRCGVNLNREACTCAPEPADARLAGLEAWMQLHGDGAAQAHQASDTEERSD